MIRYSYDLEKNAVRPELLELTVRVEAEHEALENIKEIADEKGKI